MGSVRNTVLVGDVRAMLRTLPADSVDCVITSPPYYLLRDYAVAGQIGLEDSIEGWVSSLREVMTELARVLKDSGTVFLNLGQSYSRHSKYGAPAKSLLLGPERLLTALVADGWICRNVLVWAKPNALPSSVADRFNTTWEPVYFLTQSPKYYFDLDAVRVPHTSTPSNPTPLTHPVPSTRPVWAGPLAGSQSGLLRLKAAGTPGHRKGKNPGDVWNVATAGFRGAHFATFPPKLVERPLLAGCPERVCRRCGSPWIRAEVDAMNRGRPEPSDRPGQDEDTVLRPTCRCRTGFRPGLVLDPFCGAGTVGLVAEAHGRDWLGIELNASYAELAQRRIAAARTRPARRAA
jgi:site-specific DNA-methyltransferase (adenine-specific)